MINRIPEIPRTMEELLTPAEVDAFTGLAARAARAEALGSSASPLTELAFCAGALAVCEIMRNEIISRRERLEEPATPHYQGGKNFEIVPKGDYTPKEVLIGLHQGILQVQLKRQRWPKRTK